MTWRDLGAKIDFKLGTPFPAQQAFYADGRIPTPPECDQGGALASLLLTESLGDRDVEGVSAARETGTNIEITDEMGLTQSLVPWPVTPHSGCETGVRGLGLGA